MEEKVQKNNSKKAIIGVVIVVVIAIIAVIGYVGFNAYKEVSQRVILNEELTTLSKKTLGKDNFNTEIKTSGDYAKVEKTIKEYLQKYSDAINAITEESAKTANIQGVVEKEKLEGRKSEVQQIKTNVENSVNTIIEMSSEEYIKKQIEEQGLSQKYVDLYNELMIGDLSSKLAKEKETMSTTKDKVMELFDKVIETYDYLLQHKDSWKVENGQLLFYNSTELREYNKLVQELQTKARLMTLTR